MGFKESIARINTGIATAIFTTCIAISAIGCQPRYRPIDNERLTDHLTNRDLANIIQCMSKRAKAKYNILPCGAVGGDIRNPIKHVNCTFRATDVRLNIDEARIFSLPVIDSLIDEINSYPNAQQILDEFPFPSSKLYVILFLDEISNSSNSNLAGTSYIDGVKLYRDQLKYLKYNKIRDQYEVIFEEALEEARQKIALRQPNN